jgi:pimeloyl-ACP methyl ester carboxylesterase
MTTFVLVHGAWGGSWQWGGTARLLRDAGHDVFNPSLTGCGERAHLMGPDIDLETHIQDVIGLMDYEMLNDIALVGHSYAGMIVTAIADRMPERLRALIYIDAALPKDGEAMLDIVSAERKQTVIGLANEHGEGIWVPQTLVLETGIEDDSERENFLNRMCPHPLAALLQPLSLTGNFTKVPRKAYIFAARNNSHRFLEYRDWAAEQSDWTAETMDTWHFPMVTQTRETADLLNRLVT